MPAWQYLGEGCPVPGPHVSLAEQSWQEEQQSTPLSQLREKHMFHSCLLSVIAKTNKNICGHDGSSHVPSLVLGQVLRHALTPILM